MTACSGNAIESRAAIARKPNAMTHFHLRLALRTLAFSLILSACSAPLAWWAARQSAMATLTEVALEDSRRVVGEQAAVQRARQAPPKQQTA